MTSGLKVIQINLHHSKAASSVLEQKMNCEGTHIGLITEPYFNNDRIRNINTGNLIYNSQQPRACIFLKKDIDYFSLNDFNDRDVVAVKVKSKINMSLKEVVICSAYFDGNKEIPDKLNNLIEYCSREKLDIIIGTDSNAHHTIWGDKTIDRRGEMVLDFIIESNLEIINRGTTPTFVRQNCETVIDLTLAKGDITENVTQWKVSNEESMSDHRYIVFNIVNDNREEESYRVPEATNWDIYLSELKDNLRNVNQNPFKGINELENYSREIKEAITNAFHAACPEKTKRLKPRTPWWTKNLEEKKTKCRKLFRKAREHKYDKPELWENYKKLLHNITLK